MSQLVIARLLLYLVFLTPILCISQIFFECGTEEDCRREAVMMICALDVQRFCFHKFRSRCEMEVVECRQRERYRIYPDKFCNYGDLLCGDERTEFLKDWARQHTIDEIVFGLYDKANDPDIYLQTFWKTMLNLETFDI